MRRALVGVSAPIVLEAGATLADVDRALLEAGGSLAIVVDASGTYQGTVTAADVQCAADRDTAVATRLSTSVPILEPESEVASAMRAMTEADVDHVLVVERNGDLLGVLSRRDLERQEPER